MTDVRSPTPASMTEQAYTRLEELIVTLRLQPGEFLSENALADQLDLGRTPIREALQRLAREGMVTVLPRRGIVVADSDPDQQLLVLEVRRELERLLGTLGAARATAEQRAQFHALADGMHLAAGTGDDRSFLRLDRDHNLLLCEAAHNEFAARSMRLIGGLSRRFWFQHYRSTADLPLCARLHAEQARSIALGDVTAAALACDRLVDYTVTFAKDVKQSQAGRAAVASSIVVNRQSNS